MVYQFRVGRLGGWKADGAYARRTCQASGVAMYKHILIATDGSDLAAKAVTTGLALAKQIGAKVTAVSASVPFTTMMVAGDPGAAFPSMEYERVAAENAVDILQKVSSAAKAAGVTCETVQ